jgi:hypothetical protein
VPTLLRVLHFPHVKLANARDGVPSVDDRRRLPLRFGEDDIDEIFRGRDRRDLFEIVLHGESNSLSVCLRNSQRCSRFSCASASLKAALSTCFEAAVKICRRLCKALPAHDHLGFTTNPKLRLWQKETKNIPFCAPKSNSIRSYSIDPPVGAAERERERK